MIWLLGSQSPHHHNMNTLIVDDELLDERLEDELVALRQAILRVNPGVILDGRFESMITSPISILVVARELIELTSDHAYADALVS